MEERLLYDSVRKYEYFSALCYRTERRCMAEIYETGHAQEKVVLVAVSLDNDDMTDRSLDELEELVRTAGGEAAGRIIQNREAFSAATYIGKGKIEEVKDMIAETGATGIVCDDELSPAQMSNLEDALDTKVMDRTMLILDIFAKHASSNEGKLQVELAQLKYRSSKLVGSRSAMSRVTYGIGMRGPGEKKLEVDRRLIRNRISLLKAELEEVDRTRDVTRALRSRNAVPVIAIVGYTNAGKSTLLNYLTDAGILEADMLFATLDPTTRNMKLECGQEILLTDTVGFIRKLPHHLIDAFRSTLEEAKYADVILHVIDASDSEADEKMHVVYKTLEKLGVKDKPVVAVFNKQDKLISPESVKDLRADRSVRISAKTGAGVDKLLEAVEELLKEKKKYFEGTVPYTAAGLLQQVRKAGQLVEEEYREDGIFIKAYVPADVYGRLMK